MRRIRYHSERIKAMSATRCLVTRRITVETKGLYAIDPLQINIPIQFASANTSSKLEQYGYEVCFDLSLPEGKCVGLKLMKLPPGHRDELSRQNILGHQKKVGINTDEIHSVHLASHHWIYDSIHPDEVEYGLTELKGNIKNAQCFWLGRLALRKGLEKLVAEESSENISGLQDHCILKDSYGRPKIPIGFVGSISHKGNVGVALVANVENDMDVAARMGVGIDIENRFPTRRNIARKILTPHEIDDLGKLDVSLCANVSQIFHRATI
jgi:4'-phosphopantetheinyl transferase N-terminal domain